MNTSPYVISDRIDNNTKMEVYETVLPGLNQTKSSNISS